MMTFRTIAIVAAVVLLAGGAVAPIVAKRVASVAAQSPTAPVRAVVEVAAVTEAPVKHALRVSGTLKSGSEASLSPKQGGKVTAVLVREGEQVRSGQTLVTLDASDAQRQAEQAAAGLAVARATWQKAIDGERLKRVAVEQRVRDAQQGVEQARLQVEKAEAGIRLQNRASQAEIARAQAGVDAAQSALAKARKGARPQEREQARIQLAQAERGQATAKANLDDVQFLFDRGGVPRIQLEQAQEGYRKAQDGVAQARAQLDLVNSGATAEEIAAAEAQVRTAEAGLTAARAAADSKEVDAASIGAAKSQLRQAQDGLAAAKASRAELQVAASDVAAARAGYEQALAASRLASQQLASASLVSPVDGVVTSVSANPGELAGPGRPLVTVVGTSGVYLEAAVPSRQLAQLREGQTAEVKLDALPGRAFRGVVRSVSTVAGPDGRSFPARIDVSAPPGVLKPGGFARAEISAGDGAALAVPPEAVRASGSGAAVWVVREGRLAEVPVELLSQDATRALVRGSLHGGDRAVLAAPPGTSIGDEVEAHAR
jgi:RND family efflux transporter MFP subunit